MNRRFAGLDKNVADKLPKPNREKWSAENCTEVDAYNKAIKDDVNPKGYGNTYSMREVRKKGQCNML